MKKECIIIAGANGTGKTTFALDYCQEYQIKFINSDEIARKIDPLNLNKHRIKSGKTFYKQIGVEIENGNSFVVESTLSGITFKNILSKLKGKGYKTTIIYIFLNTTKICIDRVQERVLKGGHHVPDVDVIRRYHRSIKNFWNTYKLISDNWILISNSDQHFSKIAFGEKNQYIINNKKIFDSFMERMQE